MNQPTNYIFRISQISFLILFTLLFSLNVEAQKKKRKKKNNTELQAPKPVKKPKTKTIADLVKSSIEFDGLFKVYQDTITGSVQMVISENQINKEYIYFRQIADGVTDIGFNVRGAYGVSKIFKIERYFNKIEFISQNSSFYFDPKNPISKSKEANISKGHMASVKIEAHDKEKGLYLIKADGLFLKETFSQIKPPRFPGQSPTAFSIGNLDKGKSKINSIRNYKDNTDFAVEYVYSKPSTLSNGSVSVTDGRNVNIKVFHSLLAMPNNHFESRREDPRVGYFSSLITDQTSTSSTPYRDVIHRWNLKKKNPNAVISDPVKPITWWIENTTPHEWRDIIKEGVLEWNKAFEKAGFRNAMVVKVQPDDATWDAGDIHHNVLRWTSTTNPFFGGYGPHFTNPRTGETLGADIMLEYVHFTNRVMYDRIYELSSNNAAFDYNKFAEKHHLNCSLGHVMHENTLFGQTVIAAAGASDLEMARMKKEGMKALIMHEVGHTLGLSHNMKASQLYSPEQLEDRTFMKGKALIGSIMDYPAIHLTNNKSNQGNYFSTTIGPYDYWAIELGYKPFKTEQERLDLLSLSTQPEYMFGNDSEDMRAPGKAIDPRVMIYDLSNNSIDYFINRFELIDSLMKQIKTKFSKKGESYQELRRTYYILSAQKDIAGGILARQIGGIHVDHAMVGQDGGTQPYTPVSSQDQQKAMTALGKYVFSPNAFKVPNNLYNYLAIQRRGYTFSTSGADPKIHDQVLSYQRNVLNHILHPNTLRRITNSELYGNQYTLAIFMNDLNDAIFKADIQSNVNSFRQNLQIDYTNRLISMLNGNNNSRFTNNSKSMAVYNLKKIRAMASPSGDISSRAHKQHLRTLIDNALKDIK